MIFSLSSSVIENFSFSAVSHCVVICSIPFCGRLESTGLFDSSCTAPLPPRRQISSTAWLSAFFSRNKHLLLLQDRYEPSKIKTYLIERKLKEFDYAPDHTL